MRRFLAAAIAFACASFCIVDSADARPRKMRAQVHHSHVSQVDDSRYIGSGGMVYREPVRGLKRAGRTVARKAAKATVKTATIVVASADATADGLIDTAAGSANIIAGYADHLVKGSRHSLSGFPAPLVAKVLEIERDCPGAKRISTFRPGARVRGSGVRSLHSIKRAVDMAGNPSCMYGKLRSWPGGVSIDYARVRHIHFSYQPRGMEWGARFAHYGSRKGKRRSRYARVQ